MNRFKQDVPSNQREDKTEDGQAQNRADAVNVSFLRALLHESRVFEQIVNLKEPSLRQDYGGMF